MDDRNLYAPVYVNFDGQQRSLRATRRIRQGETIYHLPTHTRPNADMYSIEAYPDVHIDCEYSAAGAINHSCSPNAAVKDMRIVAWACIKPGEDITIDYRITEKHLSCPFDCKCGSKNCVGRIANDA